MTAKMPSAHLFIDPANPGYAHLFDASGESTGFMPSAASVREQRAREQADRTVKQFIEHFPQKDFFPEDSEHVLFALLPQLRDWPQSLLLEVHNEQGATIAVYAKGDEAGTAKSSVILVQRNDGEYTVQGETTHTADDEEWLFKLILDQLPAGSTLGAGGNFPGAESTDGRIVTIREQIADLARRNSPHLFDALLADDIWFKADPDIRVPNPFWPLWIQVPEGRSTVLKTLMALDPQMPVGRLDAVLAQSPLSEAQQGEFLEKGTLPDPLIDALAASTEEWRKDRGIDGVFHTRTYNPDADALARRFSQSLLDELFGYKLVIIEQGESRAHDDPDTARIVLLHHGDGHYAVEDSPNGKIDQLKADTDSFYLAIGAALQPHEWSRLGMRFNGDVAGLRKAVGNRVATASGGWFEPENAVQVKSELLPGWMKNASNEDKALWNLALQTYRQAIAQAQAPDLPQVGQYDDPDQLHSYAREQIGRRLDSDLGLQLNPDEITIETTQSEWTGNWEAPPGLYANGHSPDGEFEYTTMRRSLTRLCLENLRIDDLDFWLTARALDKDDKLLSALDKRYLLGLVRELNVGDSYMAFLEQRLLKSSEGEWSRERYAQVMDAQMRLDAIEARMSKDFRDDGSLQPDRANRGYKWVMAVLDHPADDGGRPLVEGHRIQVSRLNLRYAAHGDRVAHAIAGLGAWSDLEGLALEGVLMIAPESRQSVPGMVIYTPSAPDGVRFREFSSHAEMDEELLYIPELREYLASCLPAHNQAAFQQIWRESAIRHLKIDTGSSVTRNFYEVSYEAEVARIIRQVDAQTTSTSEANWSTAWNVVSKLGEFALEFAPFKVALPIAAARSLYAMSHGINGIGRGDTSAVMHFAQAGLLLADGLPGVPRSKATLPVFTGLDVKKAHRMVPLGLKLRSDGIYNGVYEKTKAVGPSDFYVRQGNKVFSIAYDASDSTWRVIDARRPDAYYRMPIQLDAQGHWVHAPVGLRGGVKSRAKDAPGRNKPAEPVAGAAPGVKKVMMLDMEGFYESRQFKIAQKNIQDDLRPAVEKAVLKYREEGKGSLHPSKGGFYSLDLPGVGRSTGRGAWRLLFWPPVKGVLKVHTVANPH